jgi:perosamine synthetase
MSDDFVPVNQPLLDGNEKKYLANCIDTAWISSDGPFVRRLEEEVAARIGRQYAIAVCNGSAALDVAVAALRLKPGDEVILPTFTIISCAAAVIRAGATPVVVDADPATWNMDVQQLGGRITPRTRAVMVVHTYGLPVEMDPVLKLTKQHGLSLIEDAAEVIGQTYNGKPCGSFGEISTLSFYPNKHITTGEGGMLLTNDAQLAERCRSLRNLCFQKERFVHEELGWNFRMSNIQAAVGVAQLERLDQFIDRKRQIGRQYDELLGGTRELQLPVQATSYAKNIYWVYGVVLNDVTPFNAQSAMEQLTQQGVGTRPFFWPMHEQPVFRRMGLFKNARCPIAERIARRGFYLPTGLAITESQQKRVARAVKEILKRARN